MNKKILVLLTMCLTQHVYASAPQIDGADRKRADQLKALKRRTNNPIAGKRLEQELLLANIINFCDFKNKVTTVKGTLFYDSTTRQIYMIDPTDRSRIPFFTISRASDKEVRDFLATGADRFFSKKASDFFGVEYFSPQDANITLRQELANKRMANFVVDAIIGKWLL